MASRDPVPPGEAGYGGLPGPLRDFADRLGEVRSAEVLDLDQVGRVMAELAADEEFFGPLIAQLPPASPGSQWLIRPERGSRLVLVHRPEGIMGYTRSRPATRAGTTADPKDRKAGISRERLKTPPGRLQEDEAQAPEQPRQ